MRTHSASQLAIVRAQWSFQEESSTNQKPHKRLHVVIYLFKESRRGEGEYLSGL
jgi:hypothetical protein